MFDARLQAGQYGRASVGVRRPLLGARWSESARQRTLALACMLLAGCSDPVTAPIAEARPLPAPANPARIAQTLPLSVPADVQFIILHVQTPRAARDQLNRVWDLVREDSVDSETAVRLYSNGVRMGVGQIARWDAIKDIFNATEKSRVYELPPMHNPPGVPLGLHLDATPRDQTIFFLDDDGILTGDTWPASQKVLRLTYEPDPLQRDSVRLMVVPEIRQELPPALTYTTTEGWATGRRREGRAYGSAAFEIPLSTEEFVMVGPGEKADVFGMVGGAFLTGLVNDERYDTFVFIRAEISHGRPTR